jgi:hypothetical protein
MSCVVSVHESAYRGTYFVQGGKGVPVKVLVFENAPE